MEKNNKFVEFVKKHKKGVAVAAGTVIGVVGGIAYWAITRDKSSNYIEMPKPELSSGNWIELFKGIKGKHEDCIAGAVHNVDITDLGNFGDALATVEGVDGHEPICLLFATEKGLT